MSDERKESRINIEDLRQGEQELTPEEAKEVKGGILPYIEQDNLAARKSLGITPTSLQADDVNADNEATFEGRRKL